MANADISLLFGVLGEGSLSGESGSLIQSQLQQIMTALNKNPLKVKVALDTDAGGQRSWSSQLQKKLDDLSNSDKFGIKVQLSKLTLGAGAISDFRKQLNAVVNTLNLDKGVSLTLTAEGIGEIKSKMKEAGDSATDAAAKIAAFKVQLEALSRMKTNLDKVITSLEKTSKTEEDAAAVKALRQEYEQLALKIEEIRAAKTATSEDNRAAIEAEYSRILDSAHAMEQQRAAAEDAAAAENAKAEAERNDADAANAVADAAANAAKMQREVDAARKQGIALLTQMQKAERDWTAAANGKSSSSYAGIKQDIVYLSDYLKQLESGKITVEQFAQKLAGIRASFAGYTQEIKAAGENTKTFLQRIGNLAQKFTTWFSITRVVMAAIRTIRQMVANTRDINSALTQLRIVTGATDAQMEAFLVKSTALAKELGQSITDVLKSIETFSRLGYNLEDASQLAEYANILANVASVGTADATTGLTSIIKGFNMDVSNAEHVADVLVQVGQKYAVSAGEMMEAYEKAGAALNAANTSFEKSAGLIAAANASVQNASTVGTALKTISARIRGATADLEELGENTEELAQGFSKYAKELKAITGFDIMVDGTTDTYKDIYEIFDGISKVWDKLSDTQQARVSEILGGTRQLQVISSILGNWSDSVNAYTDAMNSAGAATKANETYMDSISGRIGILKATFQEFSNDLLNSELIKFFVDLATAIIKALDALEKLHLLVPMIISVTVAIKALQTGLAAMRSAAAAAETTAAINAIVAKLVAEKGATDALAASVANLSLAEKAELASKIQAAVVSKELTAAEAEQILATLGLVTSEGTLTVANHTLAASFKSLMASIPVWGWIALGISAVITVVTALTSSIKSSEEKLEELNNEFKELVSKIKTAESEFRSLRDSAKDVIPRFAELAKGVNQFGENVSLTDDEYEEFLSLNNRIAEMFPELNLGMDSNGNAMLALSYSADTMTDSLLALVEAERQAAAEEIGKTMPDVLGNITSAEKEYRKQIRAAKETADEWREVYNDIVNQTLPTTIGRYASQEAAWEDAMEFIEKAQRLGMHGGLYEDTQNNPPNNGHLYKVQWDYDTVNLEYAKQVLDSILAGQETIINNYENLIEARWSELNRVVGYWTETNFLYNDLNGQMQSIAKTMISGLDFSSLGLTTEKEVQNYVEDYILRPLFLATPEVKSAFAKLTDWQDALKNGEISKEEFKTNVEEMFKELIDSVDVSKRDEFINAFVAGFNAIGVSGSNFDAVVSGIINNWGAVTGAMSSDNGAIDNLNGLAESLSELQKALKILETAEEEMRTGGLSADTIASLAAAEEKYLDYLYEENGVVKLNTEAWKENAAAKMLGDMSALQAEIDRLEERNESIRTTLNDINERLIASGTSGGSAAVQIASLNDELQANTDAIAENQAKLAIYSALYGNITGDMNAYAAALQNFTNIASTIDTVSDSFQTLADLQAQVADGFTLSLEKALEFAKVYPEILNSAQVSADGQIILNEDVVNSFIQGKKAELDAQIDAEIAKLESDKAVLEAKMEAAQAQLDLAKAVAEGEGGISKELAEYRINAGNAVAQAMIDAGIDEATAFKLAAAAMAQNAEEFDRVAMEVCTDVDGNFNQAAFDMAQTMYRNLTNVKTDLASVARQAHQTAQAIAGIADGTVRGSDGIQGGSGGGVGGSGIKLNLTSGSFNGTEYTYEAKESGLEDFIAKMELDISSYQDAISQINGQIATLQALKNIPLDKFKSDRNGGSSSKSPSDKNKDEVKEYLADIDAYYAALKKLESIQLKRARIEARIENSDDNEEKIALTKELIGVYHQEAAALENLNSLRSETIQSGIEQLKALGFQIEYNAETNEFFVKNLEHLNELQADSVGEYESLQEATNALRENTEGLIDSLEKLNSENQNGASSIRELTKSVKDAKNAIVEYLQEIVKKANEVVDGFQNVYKTLTDAAKEYAQNGFLSVDSLQSILDLGPKYLQYLYNENGQLIINEQSLQKVIAAKTEEMAAETALSYAKQILLATEQKESDVLATLTQANTEATGSTWNMAYATIGLARAIGVANGMDSRYYDDAVSHLQKMQSLTTTAVNSISAYYQTLDDGYINQKSGLEKILELTKEMIKQENKDMIDALEQQKKDYADIVSLRKEALKAAKEQGKYDDQVAEKIKAIAKLQERINTLSLDDSRDAQAEKIKLEEQMHDLQKELADLQADHAIEAQENALDEIQKAYEDQKDDEIKACEDTLSSEEKLYQAAIARIGEGWEALYKDLLEWNYNYGSTLQSDLVNAWDAASEAVQRYGSFVKALEGVNSYTNLGGYDTVGATTGGQTYGDASKIITQMRQNSISWWTASDAQRQQLDANQLALAEQYRQVSGDNISRVNGSWYHEDGSRLYSVGKDEVINAIVSQMKANSAEHHNASTARKQELSNENLVLGARLGSYLGKNVYRDSNGAWWIEGRRLYDVYHRGGIAGNQPTLKQDEVMAILKKGEPVLDEQREAALYRIIDFTTALSEKLGKAISASPMAGSLVTAKSGLTDLQSSALESITNNQNETIHFGDVYIYGANEETVERHREVNRQFTNEVLKQLNIRK